MKTIELTSENFDKTLADTTLPVLVDFHAQWCGPCKMLAPVLEQLAEEKDGEAIIAKVDIDAAKDLAARFEVRSVPTLIVFKDGEAVVGTRGAQPKAALASLIEQAAAGSVES
ncbi:MAG: thioredoxin [Verrucomicrobiales bacterium]|nr:thioredoxin [Verrucomicrobiales bacterium]